MTEDFHLSYDLKPGDNMSESSKNLENGENLEYSCDAEKNCLTLKKVNGHYDFENFDDSQHLHGCPLKWFYNKKLSEKNKMYRVGRWSAKEREKEEKVRRNGKNTRDKTPVDVKIYKINLIEKYSKKDEENSPALCKQIKNPFKSSEMLELHRKKLAAKLNHKIQDDEDIQDNDNVCDGVDGSSCSNNKGLPLFSDFEVPELRYNYLPPRPLVGLKPLLTILLLPYKEMGCCTTKICLESTSRKGKETETTPTMSVKSLNFPELSPREEPKTTRPIKKASKSLDSHKKLQIPTRITIDLRKLSRPNSEKIQTEKQFSNYLVGKQTRKKINKDQKINRSLSNLFYELKDKTNYRNISENNFENFLKGLTVEDHESKIKRFLYYNWSNTNSLATSRKNIATSKEEKATKFNQQNQDLTPEQSPSDAYEELQLTCDKLKMFRKIPKKKKF